MAFQLPNGSTISIASTYGASTITTSVSNATEAVAALTSAAPLQIRNDIQTQYLVQQITNDMFLYTSPNIGTSSIAQYQMGVFSKAAMTLDFRRGFRIEPQRDASNRLTELNATMVYGHALIQPTYGVLIKGTVLTTVNN